MSEKRCKSCNAILLESENQCRYCGTKQEEAQPIIQQENKQKNNNRIFYSLILLVSFGFILFGIMMKNNLLLGIGLLGLPIILYMLVKLYKAYQKHIVNKKKLSNFEQFVGFIVLVLFVLGRMYLSDLLDEHSIKPDGYSYAIEPGYEYIEPITTKDIQSRFEAQIQKITDQYEIAYIEEVNEKFIIEIDIMVTDDRKEAVEIFTKLVNYLYVSKANYPYIKSLSMHYYFDNEYLYSARLHNLFLKEVIKLETDGTFYDAQSDVSILFRTLKEGYTFPKVMVEYDKPLPESAENYLKDYNNWYGDFDEIGLELFEQLDKVSNRYIDENIKPTTAEIVTIESLIRKFKNRCTAFDQLETDEYYEVFHQYFSRGCQYYVRAYSINLEGLKNSSKDRIVYSYLDYNIAYDYFNQIFDYEDDVVGSDA